MSFQQVQKYERGANRIASSILVRVAGALACAPGDLLVSGKTKRRAASPADREADAIAMRIKMLKSAPARKKLLAAIGALLADAEAAPKKPATANVKAKPKKAPPKPPAKKRKPSR